jgi:hypothetical protein
MKAGARDRSRWGILAKALSAALVLVAVKAGVNALGWEFIETLSLLTALMGGVVFTLAILVSGVLSDFKESERIVGELASGLRRLHWDLEVIARGETLTRMQGHVLELTRAVNASLRDGNAVRLREIYKPIEALDRGLAQAVAGGAPTSPARTVQVGLGNVVRIVDRLEVIIETTFVKAAYAYAGLAVGAATVALTFTQLRPVNQGLFLYGFAVFLIVGLFLLIADLDNPFAGDVRISTRQLDKLEAFLAEHAGPPATKLEAPPVA